MPIEKQTRAADTTSSEGGHRCVCIFRRQAGRMGTGARDDSLDAKKRKCKHKVQHAPHGNKKRKNVYLFSRGKCRHAIDTSMPTSPRESRATQHLHAFPRRQTLTGPKKLSAAASPPRPRPPAHSPALGDLNVSHGLGSCEESDDDTVKPSSGSGGE